MKKSILFTLLILAFGSTVFSQVSGEYSSSRLDNYANQLKRKTVDLADRASENLRSGYSASRTDIDNAFLAVQLDAAAGLFQQMVGDNRKASELRDASAVISDLLRRAPTTYGSNNYAWRDVQNSVNDINRELGGNGGGYDNGGNNGGSNPPDRPVIGRATWRGTVDNVVQLRVRDRDIETVTIAGTPYGEGAFSFTSALPRSRSGGVTVEVNKKKGRGDVRVVQQPSNQNDFTAIVEISDRDGGAKEYELDIYWHNR
jgi:hypothetical protein